jgi:hypothetical protein
LLVGTACLPAIFIILGGPQAQLVTDKSGNAVTGLKQQDFTFVDNGQPEKMVSFQAFDGAARNVTALGDVDGEPPVEVILVFDELNLPSLQVSEPVTVQQLEHSLNTAKSISDTQMTQQLSLMQLTERLSTSRLKKFETTLKGKKARQALVALADRSVFLAPPADEIPLIAPPDAAAQRLLVSRAIAYVNHTIPRLPNFFADRTTVEYHQRPPERGQTWKTATDIGR